MKKEWYVVNTVSGHEYKVKEELTLWIYKKIFLGLLFQNKKK